jgi:hypothetical protein
MEVATAHRQPAPTPATKPWSARLYRFLPIQRSLRACLLWVRRIPWLRSYPLQRARLGFVWAGCGGVFRLLVNSSFVFTRYAIEQAKLVGSDKAVTESGIPIYLSLKVLFQGFTDGRYLMPL